MALVKLVVEKKNTSGVSQSITPIRILQSIVSRQGSRAVDTGEFTISIKHDVQVNDTVKYIQDIVDTENLTAIYNFQANDMDESGNDIDGDDTHILYRHPQIVSGTFGTIQKFSPNYSAEFDGTVGKKITVTDNAKLDFSKQFDIVAFVTTLHTASGATNSRRIFFSKYDSGVSGNGIEIGTEKLGTNTWAVYAVVKTGGVVTHITGNVTDYYMGSSTPRMIRLRRDGSNKIYLTINGSSAGTTINTISGSFDNTTDMILGSNYNDSTPFHGMMHQLRIYIGINLTDDQIEIIGSSAPQPMTMKFLGRVYKVDDKTREKKVFCKGGGKILLQTNLNASILGSTHTDEDATRTNNDTVFDAGQDIPDIIQSIIKRVDPAFKFYNAPASASLVGEYIAEGNFVQNVNILTLHDALTFFTLPRKLFVIENDSGVGTKQTASGDNYLFEGSVSGGHDINKSGKNDSRTVNDIEVIGRLKTLHKKENLNSGSALAVSTSYPLSFSPQNLVLRKNSDDSLYEDSGGNIAYSFNFDKKTITTTSSAPTVTVYAEYWYEDIASSDALYRRDIGSNLADVERYSKKIYLTQFNHRTDFNTWGQKYVASSRISQNERITIKSPFLINSLRENQKINIKNVKKFTEANNTKLNMIVKSIEWLYPEGMTIITCGEHDFDSYDFDQDTSESLSGLTSSLTKTKTV